MSDSAYQPPKVWQWQQSSGGKFANINRPISGPTHEKPLPKGDHGLQLYSMATPNGVKVTILLEELLAAGVSEAEYNAFYIDIMNGDQFSSGFVDINPNSKIPALVDNSGAKPVRIFESGAILQYLAEKFGHFLPQSLEAKAEVLSWLNWQMGSGPIVGGGFGHFYAYAPEKYEYPINRYTMEVKRLLHVLDTQLANNEFVCGDELTIADMAIWPWFGGLVLNRVYGAAEFLAVQEYPHVVRWSQQLAKRPGFIRGTMVNKTWGDENEQVPERHSAGDIDRKLQMTEES